MILGVDVGGTNMRIGLVAWDYTLACPCQVEPSSSFCLADEPIKKFGELIQDYIKKYGIDRLDAVSVGIPAPVETDFRTVYIAPNLKDANGQPVLDHKNLAEELEKQLGCPVYINKDVNNLLYYDMQTEHMDGIVAGCYVGTGIGSAVAINGQLLYGENGVAMDLGHVSLFRENESCSCGKSGCAETKAAGKTLVEIWKTYYSDHGLEEIFTAYGQEERIRQFVSDCAHIPAMMAAVFNPKYLILGGGIIEMKDFPRDFLEAEILRQTTQAVVAFPPVFFYSEKLAERGVIGAACFAEEMRRRSGSC